jgi:hypothetical protein
MSSLPESLLRFRTELEDAIRRELEAQATARSNGWGARVLRAVRRRPGRIMLAFAAVAGAAAAALFVSGPWKTSPSLGFLEEVQAALTPPDGTVLHMKVVLTKKPAGCEVSHPPIEYWVDQTPPYQYRGFDVPDICTAGTLIEIGGEAASRKTLMFLPPNTLATGPPWPIGPDWVASLRQAIHDGTAQHAGRAVLDGRTVERIRIGCSHARFPICDPVVAYVDQNLHPVRVEWGGGLFSQDFVTYKYLPGTPANRALADIRAQHPDATPVARKERP